AVAPLVTHEVTLRLGILPRPQAIEDVFILVNKNAAAGAAVYTNAFLRPQEPDALLVKEILAAQGTDGAEIDDITGQLVLQWLAGEDVDLGVISPVDDLKFRRAANFTRKAHAARAHDAAIGEETNRIADVRLIGRRVFLVDHPAP